jgi:hypothetical protein
MLGIPKEKGLEAEGIYWESWFCIPKINPKGFIPMGRAELMGWESLDEGASGTHTIEDKGVKGTPLIKEDRGVERLPETFISDLVLMVGWLKDWEVEIYAPCLINLCLLEGGFGKGSRRSGNFKRIRDWWGGLSCSMMTQKLRYNEKF